MVWFLYSSADRYESVYAKNWNKRNIFVLSFFYNLLAESRLVSPPSIGINIFLLSVYQTLTIHFCTNTYKSVYMKDLIILFTTTQSGLRVRALIGPVFSIWKKSLNIVLSAPGNFWMWMSVYDIFLHILEKHFSSNLVWRITSKK